MTPIARKIATFFAIFFVVNLIFDAYRAGGLTLGALAAALTVSVLATAVYAALVLYRARKETDE